jgi:hypothetical protein
MAQQGKLIRGLLNNPKDVRVEDACKIARWAGFEEQGGKGRHRFFSKPGFPLVLNFQDRGDGRIPTYQAKQLIDVLEELGLT